MRCYSVQPWILSGRAVIKRIPVHTGKRIIIVRMVVDYIENNGDSILMAGVNKSFIFILSSIRGIQCKV